MVKVQKLSELSQSFSFTEYDFYEHNLRTFENTVLGKMKKLLPLREMADSFGLVSMRRRAKRGPKPYFIPEGKVALMFLKVYRQQSNYFENGNPRESVPDRIVSVSKPYVRPIVRGKEVKSVEFGAKCNNIQVDGISFIEKLSFNAFKGTRLQHCVKMHKRLFGVD